MIVLTASGALDLPEEYAMRLMEQGRAWLPEAAPEETAEPLTEPEEEPAEEPAKRKQARKKG